MVGALVRIHIGPYRKKICVSEREGDAYMHWYYEFTERKQKNGVQEHASFIDYRGAVSIPESSFEL